MKETCRAVQCLLDEDLIPGNTISVVVAGAGRQRSRSRRRTSADMREVQHIDG
jgi:hypothetical protein